MPIRIAFDLDGVLADMESELVHQAEILFGESLTQNLQQRAAADVTPTEDGSDLSTDSGIGSTDAETSPDNAPPLVKLNLTPRQQGQLWRHVASIENFWLTLKEIEPGVVRRLAEVATERRWEIIFLTRRPTSAGATAQVQTQRWLESKGFPLPSVFVVRGSRGRIAAALGLDIVVDDRPENCLDVVVDSKARAILVWRHDQQQLPASARRLGIGVVASVDECLDVLAQLESSEARARPTVMSRVRRLLGLKETANA